MEPSILRQYSRTECMNENICEVMQTEVEGRRARESPRRKWKDACFVLQRIRLLRGRKTCKGEGKLVGSWIWKK